MEILAQLGADRLFESGHDGRHVVEASDFFSDLACREGPCERCRLLRSTS